MDLSTLTRERPLVFDGATGTNLQTQDLTPDDFGGEHLAGCNEYLVRSKPSAVENVHRDYLEAGADVIETDTFGSASIVLAEYGLESLAYELSKEGAAIAKRMALQFSTKAKPRFVAGSIGPTTKLPSLGHIQFDVMRDSFYEQMAGLLDGGADLFIIETCQDLLQMKCALAAAQDLFRDKKARLPIIASVTIETMGTMLMGTEIAAALTALEPYDIISAIGMNCATGPKEMEENVRFLTQTSPKPIFIMPNAGLPENIGGHAHYHLTPEELEKYMTHFVGDLGVSIIGGCCGTTKEHIKHLSMLAERITPHARTIDWTPSASSIYSSVPMHVDPAPVIVGERCNTNGSKKFRDLLLNEDWDAAVSMAKEQIKEGSHMLDLCVAYVGRDEVRDMREVISRMNTAVTVPLVIDSTEYPVIEVALKHYAGRAIVNSINMEDGEERMAHVLPLCKKYGAAVIALTIDEDGMAKTREKKFEIAERIIDLSVNKYGMREEDLIFDTLTFTLGSGDNEFRKAGIETVEAIRMIKAAHPQCRTILGVSNISFGLNPHSRHVLNSVFLHHAIEAGLDMAIVHAAKIMPLHKIDERGRELANEIVFDARRFELLEAA
ncbi:MAG: homocysteine S-methyltransferase family protein [Bacteroidota bacterium]|nr:homocysteine S-methyltransferase family protein [Bacteroidota bacterium]MDP4232909.1 homocysteine S-methyltransferase family protein [Bacteroidota bacterium]MDP4241953.1 homocysteine S-methyltransferase family protein [Bacteroidota bacterium]MDP4286856.1 homocysteine S-methyltransferase family protein [Bacteroidota bacterium]